MYAEQQNHLGGDLISTGVWGPSPRSSRFSRFGAGAKYATRSLLKKKKKALIRGVC